MLKKLSVKENEDIVEFYQYRKIRIAFTRTKKVHTLCIGNRTPQKIFFWRCLYYPELNSDLGYEGESTIGPQDAYRMCKLSFDATGG